MKNTMKRGLALLLAALLCLGLTACYSENNTWAARKNGDTLPIGAYIYYLDSAYLDAREKVSEDEEVLKASIEDESAESWIESRAINYVNSYYFIQDKLSELGLSLTDEETAAAKSNTDSMWSYWGSSLEAMGIAKESFHKAYALYNAQYQKVMDAMYGEGGELEIPEEELRAYYTENYANYEYFYAPLTVTDEDGSSRALSDDEKTELTKKLNTYADKVTIGDMTMSEAAADYAETELGSADSSTYYIPSAGVRTDNMSTTIADALAELEDNAVTVTETSSYIYVIRKLPIDELFDAMREDADQLESVIYYMHGDDFADYVSEKADGVQGVELNQSAIGKYKVAKLVNDDNKTGTHAAESEEQG